MSEQWLPSASDQEERLPIGEDVARAYIDGRNEGRKDERARIRRELLALADGWKAESGTIEGEGYRHAMADRLRAALDRIAPEGKE